MNPNAKLVKLVHFINPSRFYFRDLSLEDEEVPQIEAIESKISEHIQRLEEGYKASLRFYIPKAGEIVAYFCSTSKKWIRCEVDDCKDYNEETTVVLWAIDYAIPLYTTNIYEIIPLPHSFRRPRNKILIGSLPLMPALIRFDHENSKVVKDIKDIWHDRACHLMKRLADSTSEVYFIPSTKCSYSEVHIGDLYFGKLSLSMRLVEDELGVTVPQCLFLKYYAKLFTNHIERWNDNSRKGGILKEAEGIPHPKAFTIEKTPEVNEEVSTEEVSTYTEEAKRKVLEWQARNEILSEPEDFESIISYQTNKLFFNSRNKNPKHPSTPNSDHSQAENPINFSGIPAKELREMLEKLPQQEDEVKVRDHTRKVILVPAGGGMCTNDKNPFYECIASDTAKLSTTSSSLFTDDKFISVSQVGSEDGHALNSSAQRHSEELSKQNNGVVQFDSMDSMNVMMKRTQI